MRTTLLRILLFLLLLSGFSEKLIAQSDSLRVRLSKQLFEYGEFIDFEASMPGFKPEENTMTLHIWIEDLGSGKRWKYRYPFLNGFVAGSFKIFSSIVKSKYAFNFMLQNEFFRIEGFQKVQLNDVKVLNYGIYLKNKQNFVEEVALNYDASFQIKYLLFQDTAQFVFSPSGKKPAENNLLLSIRSPLDSAFIPTQTVTKFVTIGQEVQLDSNWNSKITNYRMAVTENDFRIKMPTVFITAKKQTPIQKFDFENTRGIFSSNDAILLDGISSDEIARAANLIDFIMSKVAGITYEINDSGERVLSWRGSPTTVYLNELAVNDLTTLDVNPIDIALIKIFRPSSFVNSFGSGGGIIAIYTKTGEIATRKYSFKIFGYNEFDIDWK